MPRKREEATDVLQRLLPQLEDVDIPIINIKTDTATKKTRPLRGDVWISREPFNSSLWESEIICLIEAKPSHAIPGTNDWQDAIRQGNLKATKQGLPFFIVTNTDSFWHFYRVDDLVEVTIDSKPLTTPLEIRDLEILVTQISPTCNNAEREVAPPTRSYSQKQFQAALWQIKNVYRNCAIDDNDSKIHSTITFIVLKYISEQEKIRRSLVASVILWDDWRIDHMDRDINATIQDIKTSSVYTDVAKDLSIAIELRASHCVDIHNELDSFQFSGCNFDIYGAVYESFADARMKRDFGQYFTARHITAALTEILLRDEKTPKTSLKICDPACGTGGFLTEAYRMLLRNYTASGALQPRFLRRLKEETFFGYDIKDRNIALARINMCLAGDGHTNIKHTEDSLLSLPEDEYKYILTNIPYGAYKGSAGDTFRYSNKKRYEILFVEKIIRSLKANGKAVIIVPDGILESPSLEEVRINMLNDVIIEAVISLHPYVFRPYTTEKTYAIFIEKLPKTKRGLRNRDPIFMYILENDGFQKGDKRYPIRENDIPDLLSNYLTTNAKAKHEFVSYLSVNSGNFHNLLPEFYLNYYEDDYSEVSFDEYGVSINKIEKLVNYLNNLKV